MSDTSDWLTKSQVAQILCVAEKTVDRLAVKGKLQKQSRERAGLAPVVVFHPGDVERERAARNQQQEAFIMPEANSRGIVGPVVDVSEFHMTTSALARRKVDVSRTDPRVVLIQPAISPVFLTTKQAMEYSGLSEDFLLKLVRAGSLRRVAGMRGFRYKRADLDKLELP